MITTPRFKRLYRVEHLPAAGTFLLTETFPTVLNGRLNELVCPLIDGVRTADDIVTALRGRAAPAEVYYTLNILEQRGFIEEVGSDVSLPEAAFWQALNIDPEIVKCRLEANPVALVAFGDVNLAPLCDALTGVGVRVVDDARLTIAVVDDYRYPGLDDLDQHCYENQLPWAIVKPVGILAWIGPFFDLCSKGCWRCLVDRIRMNFAVDSFIEHQRPQEGPLVTSRAALPSTIASACQLTATEIAKWIGRQGESTLINTLVTLNTLTLQLHRHVLTWRPQCPRCGDPVYRARSAGQAIPQPVEFCSRKRLPAFDGGHRTAWPEETLQRYTHHVSPITGAVSRLERISPLDSRVIHAYSASHNWATHPDGLAFLKRTLRSQSGGKGTTDLQAKVGALAEAFERYSGVFRGDEPRRWATLRQIGSQAIHPNTCMLFSEAQYRNREEINRQGNAFQMVPFPFDEEAPTDWSPVWSPTHREFRWVPTAYLYYSYSKSVPRDTPNRLAVYADSNGCAAGNCLEEAALQALMELVERDAVATWWYNQVCRPAVDIDSADAPYLDELRCYLPQVHRDLWVLDITNDIGIPVFAAFSRLLEPTDGSEQLVVGFGAHLDPMIGIMRAIVEVNQFFASLDALSDDELSKVFDPGAVDWWKTATRANQPHVQPASSPVRRLTDYTDLTSDDLLEEVQTTIAMIECQGLEVLFCDLTRPDIGFPVIKAMVPGMRHFWARLAPGRLYDVPVKLGWLNAPLREEELNPVPVFF